MLLDVVYGPERSSGRAPPSLGAIPAPMQGAEPRFAAPQESGGCSQRGHARAVGVQERERAGGSCFPICCAQRQITAPLASRTGLIAAELSFLRAESHFLARPGLVMAELHVLSVQQTLCPFPLM